VVEGPSHRTSPLDRFVPERVSRRQRESHVLPQWDRRKAFGSAMMEPLSLTPFVRPGLLIRRPRGADALCDALFRFLKDCSGLGLRVSAGAFLRGPTAGPARNGRPVDDVFGFGLAWRNAHFLKSSNSPASSDAVPI
jgi:hypothetical protein